MHAILLALALSLPAAGGAPPPAQMIAVGDGRIGARALKPYTNAWMFSFVKNGKRTDQGIWSDVLRFSEVDGKRVMERIQGMTYAKGMSSFTINRFDPVTLAPIHSETHGPDGKSIIRDFSGTHVETHFAERPGAEAQARATDLPTAVYDFNGGMYGILLAAQPLHKGYSGAIPAIGEFTDDFVTIPFEVVGQETIRAGFKGRVSAWVVKVGGDSPMTFWISNDPPYILRLALPMSGGEADFDMIG